MNIFLLSIVLALLSTGILILNKRINSISQQMPASCKSFFYEIKVCNFKDENGKRYFKTINEVIFFDFLLLANISGDKSIYNIALEAYKAGFYVSIPSLQTAIDMLVEDGFLKPKNTP